MTPSRTWIGSLQTDHWDRPIVDGWQVDLSAFMGKRVEIIVRELTPDPESYEALARRDAGETPAEPGTHSVSRPDPAGASPAVPGSNDDVY